MPFPITIGYTAGQFQTLIAEYWEDLSAAIQANANIAARNKALLVADYCAIGEFLANPDAVERQLIPLEEKIREDMEWLTDKYQREFPMTLDQATGVSKPRADGGGAGLKSHKLLTNALRDAEAQGGFNHEGLMKGTFFADARQQATLFSAASQINPDGSASAAGRSPSKTPLPKGVPTIHGKLDGRAFNQILLRHGYQFKDVAAGPYHGEYTHRLQWYAIMRAKATGAITLHNSPLEIFKSMGYTVSKADKKPTVGAPPVIPEGRHLYVWEMLFDAGKSDVDADDISGTLAWCQGTWNSPENMNKSLMNLVNRGNRVSDLWCLRVLLKTRWKKRFDDGADPAKIATAMANNKVHRLLTGDAPTLAAKPERLRAPGIAPRGAVPERPGFQVNTLAQAEYVLAWYLNNPKVA